jgi:putative ABC transport system substrate-binding protein
MNTRRRLLIALGAGAMSPLASLAQQKSPAAVRIGYLGNNSAAAESSLLDAFRAGLHERGYVEGRNTVIEYRFADGRFDRLPELAAELARLKVDIIVTFGSPAVRAVMQASPTIPIVMTGSADAVATGLVASLARPGGNVTGTTILSPEVAAKRLDLLKEAMPRIVRVAVLLRSGNPANSEVDAALGRANGQGRLALHQFVVHGPDEFDTTFAQIAKARMEAVLITDDPMLNFSTRPLAEAASRHGLAAMYSPAFADAGGLIGYGGSRAGWPRAAYFVDRIVKGAKPATLPVEQPSTFELVVNQKTAKALGIEVPQSILLQATRVIG